MGKKYQEQCALRIREMTERAKNDYTPSFLYVGVAAGASVIADSFAAECDRLADELNGYRNWTPYLNPGEEFMSIYYREELTVVYQVDLDSLSIEAVYCQTGEISSLLTKSQFDEIESLVEGELKKRGEEQFAADAYDAYQAKQEEAKFVTCCPV